MKTQNPEPYKEGGFWWIRYYDDREMDVCVDCKAYDVPREQHERHLKLMEENRQYSH